MTPQHSAAFSQIPGICCSVRSAVHAAAVMTGFSCQKLCRARGGEFVTRVPVRARHQAVPGAGACIPCRCRLLSMWLSKSRQAPRPLPLSSRLHELGWQCAAMHGHGRRHATRMRGNVDYGATDAPVATRRALCVSGAAMTEPPLRCELLRLWGRQAEAAMFEPFHCRAHAASSAEPDTLLRL